VGERGIGTTSLVYAWGWRYHSNRLVIPRKFVGREELILPAQLLEVTIELFERAGRLGQLRFWRLRRTLLKLREDSILYGEKVIKRKGTITGREFLTALGLTSVAAPALYAALGNLLASSLPVLLFLAYVCAIKKEVVTEPIPNPEAKKTIIRLLAKLNEKALAQDGFNQIVVIFDFGDWAGNMVALKNWFNDMTYYLKNTTVFFVFVLNRKQFSQLDPIALRAAIGGEVRLKKPSIDQFKQLIEKRIAAVTPLGELVRNPFDDQIASLVYRRCGGDTLKMIRKCKNLLAMCVAKGTRRIEPNWIDKA